MDAWKVKTSFPRKISKKILLFTLKYQISALISLAAAWLAVASCIASSSFKGSSSLPAFVTTKRDLIGSSVLRQMVWIGAWRDGFLTWILSDPATPQVQLPSYALVRQNVYFLREFPSLLRYFNKIKPDLCRSSGSQLARKEVTASATSWLERTSHRPSVPITSTSSAPCSYCIRLYTFTCVTKTGDTMSLVTDNYSQHHYCWFHARPFVCRQKNPSWFGLLVLSLPVLFCSSSPCVLRFPSSSCDCPDHFHLTLFILSCFVPATCLRLMSRPLCSSPAPYWLISRWCI